MRLVAESHVGSSTLISRRGSELTIEARVAEMEKKRRLSRRTSGVDSMYGDMLAEVEEGPTMGWSESFVAELAKEGGLSGGGETGVEETDERKDAGTETGKEIPIHEVKFEV